MDRFEHAEPRLTSGENFIIREKGVRLYDGDDKVSSRTSDIVFVFIVRSLDLYKAKSPLDIELVNG
jgi:hypothetical protein